MFLPFWLRQLSTSQLGALYILSSKCAARHIGVHFFDIWTTKTAPTLRCFSILSSKSASRHKGVQFFISHLPRWLLTRHFSEPTCRPSRATEYSKTRCFATLLFFPRTCVFFLLTLLWFSFFFSYLLWLFPSLLFHLSNCRKFDF